MADVQDSIKQGSTYSRSVIVKNEDGTIPDLTGATAVSDMVDNSGSTTLVASTGNGKATIDATHGIINILYSASDMDIPISQYKWDVKLTLSGGFVKKSQTVVLSITKAITNT